MNFDPGNWFELSTLRVEPDDVIVVKCRRKITVEQAKILEEQVGSRFPGHRVLITVEELEIGVQA